MGDADDRRPPGPDGVADLEWQRVRDLAARVAQLEEAAGEDPDPDVLHRLARARMRASRAAERAMLADELAEELARVRRRTVS